MLSTPSTRITSKNAPQYQTPKTSLTVTGALTGTTQDIQCETNHLSDIATQIAKRLIRDNRLPTNGLGRVKENDTNSFVTLLQGTNVPSLRGTYDPSKGPLLYYVNPDIVILKELLKNSQQDPRPLLLHAETPDSLKKNPILVRIAMEHNPNSIVFAADEILNDQDFLRSISHLMLPRDQLRLIHQNPTYFGKV